MTDLQTSLIVIGVMIVGGVVCYNKWHEFRARKHVEKAFSTEPDDVLMKQSAAAPGFGAPPGAAPGVTPGTAAGTAAAPAASERYEPVFDESDLPAVVGNFFDGVGLQAPLSDTKISQTEILPVDSVVDCAIPLTLDSPVRGEKLLPLFQSLRHVGSKPVHYMGLVQSASFSSPADWRPIAHGGVYTELQAGVQLANRSGALNELEYSEVVVRLRQIGDEIGAEPDIPDMSTVMHAARSLYQFVSQHDARLGLSVRSNGMPWPLNTLLVALERLGFDVRPDGRYVMQDPDGVILFSLTTNEPVTAEYTSCLTLLLDVPRVAAEQEGFNAMVSCARTLAKRLNGTIVDDGMQTLSDAALNDIAQQVQVFYEDMQIAGIPAGSPRALRLFT